MGMNKLPPAKRTQILTLLCEGASMRSISRVCDVSINTVSKLLVDAGEACLALHDETVRNVKASRIQCDEIWSFCYAKEKNVSGAKAAADGAGDVWTWTALDADTKLIVAYYVGDRSGQSAHFGPPTRWPRERWPVCDHSGVHNGAKLAAIAQF
jgi:hypothetical protein